MENGNEGFLRQLAEHYRRRGYAVTISPGKDVLPPFAKDYQVELLAERPDGNVLVSAKPSAVEVGRDASLVDLADIVAKQPGWRFDITLAKPPAPSSEPKPRDLTDMSREQIEQSIKTAQTLYDGGFKPQAVLTAWAALESAMRHRLQSLGERADYGAPQGMLNALISAGEIDHGEFRDLEDISRLRNTIVHGFAPPPIDHVAVEFPGAIAHRLLNETTSDS